MPEGDSIHWLAEKLRRVALQKEVRAFSAHTIPDEVAEGVVGRVIVEIVARGKNLLVRFDDGRALHVHLRMMGRVSVTASSPARGVRAARPRPLAARPRSLAAPQLLLEVDGASIRGSRIPVLRLLRAGQEAREPSLSSLGPDLLAPDFDEEEALRRLRALGKRQLGDALMMQRALAGIGNVYKSELLFLERLDPRAAVADVSDDALRALMCRARALLAANVRRGPRVTRNSLAGPKTWVYLRAGKACFVCRGAITAIKQGAAPGRTTYLCERCQTGGRGNEAPR